MTDLDCKERIHNIGVEIATLAVREYVGEAEDYIAEFDSLIGQILQAFKEYIDSLKKPEDPFIDAHALAEIWKW